MTAGADIRACNSSSGGGELADGQCELHARKTQATSLPTTRRRAATTTLRDKAKNDGPAPFDVRHVLQTYAPYDLPFGRGRRVEIENGVLNAIAGGWTLGGLLTAQSGTPFRLVSGRQTVNGSDGGSC